MDQGEHSRDGELPHSMHVLKADLGRFVDNVIERERGVKNDIQVFGPRNWNDGAITRREEIR